MKSKSLLLILILIFLTCNVFAQWEWVNPYPQGTDLWKIRFVEGSDVGYSLASNGYLVKTTDGGKTWKAISWSSKPMLYAANSHCDISFVTTELGYIGGKNFVKTSDGGESWEVIGSGLHIYALDFINEDLGFVAMDTEDWDPKSIIYKVTEGGHKWEELPPNPMNRIERLLILEDSSLIIGGYQGKVVFPNYNYYYSIARSDDLGQTWTDTIFVSHVGYMRDIEFKNLNIGYACGASGFIAHTVDGGKSWERLNYDPEISPVSLGLYGDSIITITYDGSSLISTDYGNRWDSLGLESTFKMADMAINANGDCITVGGKGTIKLLPKGSSHWEPVSRNAADRDNQALFGIMFPTNETGYTGGYGGNVFKTVDNGIHWTKINTGRNTSINDLFCIDENLIYAVEGNIIRSVDGGNTWEDAFVHPNRVFDKISFVGSGYGFATGSRTSVYVTGNNGWSWRNISPDHSGYAIYDHVFFDSLNGIVVGSNKYYAQTYDGGRIWYKKNVAPQGEGNLNCVFFPSREVGYMVGTENYFYKTTDGGMSWDISDIGYGPHRYIYFVDDTIGYLVDHLVRKTTDGGNTWDTLPLISTSYFGSMCQSPDNTLFYCGREAMIMKNEEFKSNSTGISRELYVSGIHVDVWPNPVSDKLNISLAGISGETLVIKLISITGAETLVFKAEPDFNGFNEQLDVAGYPRGIYFLALQNGKNLITRKILLL